MFNFLKKKQKIKKYVIAFCDTNDISTKFGEWQEKFDTYEEAKHRIFSKACGWGKAILDTDEDKAKIDSAWLIIEEKIVIDK